MPPATHRTRRDSMESVSAERLQYLIEVVFQLKPDTRCLVRSHVPRLHFNAIRKAAERFKQARIGLNAAEPQSGSDVQRHLLPAVRNAAPRGPIVCSEHFQRAQIFNQPIAQSTVELKPIARRPEAPIADQIARV